MDKFAKRNELTKELEALNKEIFSEGCKGIFEKFPEVSQFSWTQYSPFFNDGDECVFGVNEEPRNIIINGFNLDPQDELYISSHDYDESKPREERYTPRSIEAIEAEAAETTFEDEDGNEHSFKELGISYARYSEILSGIQNFLRSQDDDVMQDTFGNHVLVYLNSDGSTSTEDYDHD